MRIEAPRVGFSPSLRALWREAFGDSDAFLDKFEALAFSPERCRVAVEDGEVVGALYWFDCEYSGGRLAYLYAVATARAHRGKGVCRTLLEDTHRHLKGLGYAGAILVPAEPSLYDFYARVGYKVCSTVRELRAECSDERMPLLEITAREYAAYRRKYLPEGAVLQESKHTLDFLASEARFYLGDELILAAREHISDGERRLFGIELLGNTAAAPRILSALGCKSGIFRTVGEGRPFAAYLPLSDAPAPTYLGFALD